MPKQANLHKKNEYYCILTYSDILLYSSTRKTENQEIIIMVKTIRLACAEEAECSWSFSEAAFPENYQYLTYLVVSKKTLLAKMSFFNLTYTLSSKASLSEAWGHLFKICRGQCFNGQHLGKSWEVHKAFEKLQHISETSENHVHVWEYTHGQGYIS